MHQTGSGPRPERTCVGCRSKALKAELVRVVRRGDGAVVLDPAGREQGRGAYVHPSRDCARKAQRTGALSRALRTRLDAAGTARLMEELTEYLRETV